MDGHSYTQLITAERTAATALPGLRVVVDNDCMGELENVNRLAALLNHHHAIKFTFPMQVVSENTQILFPEFFATKPSKLYDFSKQHPGAFELVETPVCNAYRMAFAQTVREKVKNNENLKDSIVADANGIAKKLRKQALKNHQTAAPPVDPLTKADLESLLAAIPPKKEHYDNQETLANGALELFPVSAWKHRILLQAMYATPLLQDFLAKKEKFGQFRLDQGERAIQSILSGDATGHTIVISNDKKARLMFADFNAGNNIEALDKMGLAARIGVLQMHDARNRIGTSRSGAREL